MGGCPAAPTAASGCSAAGSGTKESSGFDCPCVALSSPFIDRSRSGGFRLAAISIRGTAMERDNGQIAAVLRELADLSLRIGERAGELARLTAETRPARRSRSSESRTPEKASTNPREQTSPTPRSSRRKAALQAALHAAVKEGRGIRSRPPVGQRFLPKRRLAGRRRLLNVGPGLTSFGVHLIALLGLAMMYVKVKAEPVRVAITLGEAVELGEPAENVADEITLVAFDGPQQPDDSMESLTVAEAIAFGILLSYVVVVEGFGVPVAYYRNHTLDSTNMEDVSIGMIKGFVFGIIIVIISCHQGLHAENGAVGVGRSTTEAMVISALWVLIVNFFLSLLLNIVFPYSSAA